MRYDVVIVGGGLAGATLGKTLAEHGMRILILERETRFRDRVRGEGMHPWGVSAARALGIYERLVHSCGHQTRWWNNYAGPSLLRSRDLIETTPHRVGSFNFYHPAMQEVLLEVAERVGAEVRRGATVVHVAPGTPPSVTFHENHAPTTLQGRLVVGADGRHARMRTWGRFTVQRDPDRLVIAGVLLGGTPVPDDAVHMFRNRQGMAIWFPIGQQRARVYHIHRKSDGRGPLSGRGQLPVFLSELHARGVPAEWYAQASAVGPLAQFDGADHWVEHPARDGIVLVGDAAAATDPTWGAGLSLALLDVLALRDSLASTEHWDTAIHEYAQQHDDHYGVLHRTENWMAELLWSTGPAADARRAKVLPQLRDDPACGPDIIGLGPASRSDEATRRFLLDEV